MRRDRIVNKTSRLVPCSATELREQIALHTTPEINTD
jgi:hypothetical protein